jgi:hypothetical protein
VVTAACQRRETRACNEGRGTEGKEDAKKMEKQEAALTAGDLVPETL